VKGLEFFLSFRRTRKSSLFEHLFDVANLVLDFALELFGGSLLFQIRVVGGLAYFLLHLANCLVNLTLRLVFSTFVHGTLLTEKRMELQNFSIVSLAKEISANCPAAKSFDRAFRRLKVQNGEDQIYLRPDRPAF
jgi:hypothetical protein